MALQHAVQHAAHHGSPVAGLAILAFIAITGYLVSLSRHPRGRNCRTCRGTGKQRGLVYRYSYRSCTRCGGSGGRARIGLRVLNPRRMVWGERVPAEAAARRRHGR